METRIITLDVPVALLSRIETLAHRRRISVGQLLREELSRQLDGQRPGVGDHAAGREPVEDDDIVIDRFDRGPHR